MLAFDLPSFFIQLANFIAIIFILNFVLYKPIRGIISQRREKISGLEQNIENSRQETENKDEAFTLGIKEARILGMKEKETLMTEASDKEKEIIQQINDKAKINLEEIRNKIARDTDEAKAALQNEIDTFAASITEKILGRAV